MRSTPSLCLRAALLLACCAISSPALATPLEELVQRLRTGPAQVVFAFAIQIGMVPLTGTTSAQHMAEDLEAERLALTSDEVARIESIALAEQR